MYVLLKLTEILPGERTSQSEGKENNKKTIEWESLWSNLRNNVRVLMRTGMHVGYARACKTSISLQITYIFVSVGNSDL